MSDESAPAAEDIKYALDKFANDAKKWDECAKDLEKATKNAEALDIDSAAFGLAAAGDIHDRYHKVQEMIVQRLKEGDRELNFIANALIKARNGYLRDEAEGVHRMKQDW